MKYSLKKLILSALTLPIILTGCLKNADNPVKFTSGLFPDTVLNLGAINSQYDDYNLDIHRLMGGGPVIFSSNRNSTGGQFDLVQGNIVFAFDQDNGTFQLDAATTTDLFLDALLEKATTPGNDFGPYRFFSSDDGYEYMVLASENSNGKLDLKYLRNRPQYNSGIPSIEGPYPLTVLNSTADDAYFSVNLTQDTAYFCSSAGGNFSIYMKAKPANMDLATWFSQAATAPVLVDSVNSSGNDKCPQVMQKLMVFASDRPGGTGGYDLYYSIQKKGKWSSPINFGPRINSPYNEYRPVIGWHRDFSNLLLLFSSDRPGGQGGYDLYYTGVEIKW